MPKTPIYSTAHFPSKVGLVVAHVKGEPGFLLVRTMGRQVA